MIRYLVRNIDRTTGAVTQEKCFDEYDLENAKHYASTLAGRALVLDLWSESPCKKIVWES